MSEARGAVMPGLTSERRSRERGGKASPRSAPPASEPESRVLAAISALGGTAADVVRTVVYLAPGASWEDASRVHREVFAEVRPANTMLFVAGLIGGPYLVEVEALAVVA